MTTEQLRKEIMVTNWYMSAKGLTIDYWRGDVKKALFYSPEQSARELYAIGSIDDWHEKDNSIGIDWETETMLIYQESWSTFVTAFKFCQWEALTLAIRHELEKETDKEIDNSDIGKAIDKLK